ncbi:MAG TPA: NAD(P)/FAD-dependent oxidoreductase [Intrasporangiaceae bacterium]|nr:NAD(P)/FAD-dependent oxidoreductase [Intrasporangiaceae bacterium]
MTVLPSSSSRGASDLPDDLDVLVVGAGLSGIGMAVRLAESCPDFTMAIVEARDASGGTWDLFRYPGVRSDSDMFTLSFPFRPWRGKDSIAQGDDILDYIRDTAREHGVDERIHYGCKVVGGNWSTPEQRWTVDIEFTDDSGAVQRRQVRTAYLHLASGYYSYDTGYDPHFAGREDFTGQIVHPQFWPADLDYRGKRVVVIGSGATAVTLVPAMTDQAAHVVMLQRTPSYLFTVPGSDAIANALRAVLPAGVAHTVIRAKNVAMSSAIYGLSRRRPALAKKLILSDVSKRLPKEVVSEHFQPPYGVWDQRLCAVPDGGFFDALAAGTASIVTGRIDRFVPEGVRLTDGRVVEADIIVTATGLVMQVLGGADLSVDGEPVPLAETFAYRGAMLSGVPNASMTVGYTNASWTLRADLVARYVVRLLRHMRDYRLGIAVPVAPEGMRAGPILDLAAGYIQRTIATFPKVGDRVPWTMPQSYLHDRRAFGTADLGADMVFYPVGAQLDSVPKGAPAPAHLDGFEIPSAESAGSADPAGTDPVEAGR